MRHVLRNSATGEEQVVNLSPAQEEAFSFQDKETGVDLDKVEAKPLLEWFAEEYKKFGCTLEFVTNRSQEGSQFCRGFGGIGGVLRYQVDTSTFDEEQYEQWEDSDSDSWDSDLDFL